MKNDNENDIVNESSGLAVRHSDDVVSEYSDKPAVVGEKPVMHRSDNVPGDPVSVTEINDMEAERMGGGYASVNDTKKSDNKLVWIVLAVMCVMCVLVGIITSTLTAHFMKKGYAPPTIDSEPQQQIATVVSQRKPTVAEVACGSLHGSGVVMKLENSKVYVLTNAHVISGASVPSVRFYGEDKYYDAVTVGYNSFYDIAVLTVAYTPKYNVFDLDGSEFFSAEHEFAEGDYVVAIGNAMGMGISSYDGIISRRSDLLKHSDKIVPVTRTTAAINAGMSGGALFDAQGYFIGLGTYRMSSTEDNPDKQTASSDVEDTGFVTPVSIVYPVYKQILQYGEGGETSVLNMSYFQASTSAVGGINIPDLGFVCEYRDGKLTVTSTDQNVATEIAAGDVITAIGQVETGPDLCTAVGELLKYRRAAYTGTSLKITFFRGSTSLIKIYDGIYKNVG